jgi:drug/metabolite transporter (DMT)-like permease
MDISNLPLLLLQTIISIVPLVLIKQYINNNNYLLLLLCLLCYSIMIFIYIKLLRNNGLSKVYSLIQILQVIIVVLIGTLFFHEKLTFEIITGIILGLTGIYLIIH